LEELTEFFLRLLVLATITAAAGWQDVLDGV
jgi:hypothetical protein